MQDEYGFIDIHSHILPGVDDGAADLEQTKAMLQIAYEQGIRTIIATPHFGDGIRNDTEVLLEQHKKVQEEAFKIDNNFRIYLGNEIYYESGCLSALKDGAAFTLANSRYVLVEFSPGEDYKTMYEGMKEFILEGYIPVIAHIERYACLRKQMDRIEELTELGCYMQVNASCLNGGLFNSESAHMRKMVALGYVHFIATDSHNTTYRQPVVREAIKKLSKAVDESKIRELLKENPSKILENQYI